MKLSNLSFNHYFVSQANLKSLLVLITRVNSIVVASVILSFIKAVLAVVAFQLHHDDCAY